MRYVALLALLAGCSTQKTPSFTPVTSASSARMLVASDARLAFVDGADVRVIAVPDPAQPEAPDLLRTPASGAVTSLALGNRALAAIEGGVVRFHPFDGSPATDGDAVDAPLAVAALVDGFVWVEANTQAGDARLTIVDADAFGAVRSRVHATLDAPLLPGAPFGLALDGNDALVGVGKALVRVDRTTGNGKIAWHAPDGAIPNAVVIDADANALVVAGSSTHGGFVHRTGADGFGARDIASPFAIDLVAPDQSAASGARLVGIDGSSVEVAATAPSAITGVAAAGANVFVTLAGGLFAFQ